MRTTIIIIAWLCTMFLMNSPSWCKDWRGIVPLHSSRADVERVLGFPLEPGGSIYETENEKVFIWYSDEPCRKGVSELWNVLKDTVLSIAVYPKKKVLVSDLKLSQAKYRRVSDTHVQGIVYYVDDEEGVEIESNGSEDKVELVNSITYGPKAKDSYLRCPGSSVQQSGKDEQEYFIRKFDEYLNIPFSDEKARLDNFAIYLQKDEPDFRGYIIVYAGRHARPGEAQVRAARAKKYLVNVRGIEAKRIITIDGGYREQLQTELYALPQDFSPPTPSPMVDPSRG